MSARDDPASRFAASLRRWLPTSARTRVFDPAHEELRARHIDSATGGFRAHVDLLALWFDCWRLALTSRSSRGAEQTPVAVRHNKSRLAPPHGGNRPSPERFARTNIMQTLLNEFRYAARALRASPGFTAIAVITLGIGIGINAAIFSVVDTFLFRDLQGIDQPDEIIWVMTRTEQMSLLLNQSFPNYLDLRETNQVFESMVAYGPASVGISREDGGADRMMVASTSDNFFEALGVDAAEGRMFTAAEVETEGAPAVMVLSHDTWLSRFGGNRDLVGRTLDVNGVPVTLAGVADPEFLGIETMLGVEAYMPTTTIQQVSPGTSAVGTRRAGGFRVLGRLADGVSIGEAQQAMDVLAAELERDFPIDNEDLAIALLPEKQGRPDPSVGGGFAGIATVFMGMVGLVLAIACANVASIVLARSMGRDKEFAIRSAIGASRSRLFAQLASESLILGVSGGLVGVALAAWGTAGVRGIVAQWQISIPLRLPISVDLRLALFSVALAMLSALVAGALPALRGVRTDLSAVLNEGGRGSSAGPARQRLRRLIVVGQVAVSVVLLIVAGLFIRSVQNARNADLGFRVDNHLLVNVDPGLVDYTGEPLSLWYDELLDRARALPAVRSAALTSSMPFGIRLGFSNIFAEGRDPEAALEFSPFFRVSPDYLETAQTRLLQGRDLTTADRADSVSVALVNEQMAKLYWPDEDPLGKRFSTTGDDGPWLEVVGVVENGKYMLIWEAPGPAVFTPFAQSVPGTATLLLHTEGNPLLAATEVRQLVAELDARVPMFDVRDGASFLQYGRALMGVRLASTLVTAFGLVGIALAAIGLYGVIAYSVSQRTREFGVRVAMGAATGSLMRLVLRQGLMWMLPGALLGLVAAFAVSRLVANLLVGTSPTDPIAYLGGGLVVVLIAIAASLVPALRAARVDPAEALRSE